jgi:hypothetical protein
MAAQDYEQVTYNSATGAMIGSSATEKIAFFGITPTTQPTSSAQAALTLTTATTAGFGWSTSAGFIAAVAQLENIRASLVLLGLLKGS